jgi:BMFP domain-containing protein YqiC
LRTLAPQALAAAQEDGERAALDAAVARLDMVRRDAYEFRRDVFGAAAVANADDGGARGAVADAKASAERIVK